MPVIPETGVMGKSKTVIQIALNISKVSRNHELGATGDSVSFLVEGAFQVDFPDLVEGF